MVEFHRQLKARSAKRPVTVAEALRTAALKLPAAEAAEARFHLLAAAQAANLLRAQKSYHGRHLTLAVLYAEAGLLEEAERELQALSTANPGSQFSQKLLQELRAQRR